MLFYLFECLCTTVCGQDTKAQIVKKACEHGYNIPLIISDQYLWTHLNHLLKKGSVKFSTFYLL